MIDWDARDRAAGGRFAMDADLTVYWPDVRPCWEDWDDDEFEPRPVTAERTLSG